MHTIDCIILYWKQLFWSLIFLLVTCSTFFTLPICGFYLLGYVIILCVLSTWISFVAIQNFLQQNKSIDLLKHLNVKSAVGKKKETWDTLLSVKELTADIDTHFVEKWFVYISKDPTFSDESRILLEDVIKKMMVVQLNLDNQVIVHGVLNLYLKHLKEFRRSLKRRDKYAGRISDLYRYSHTCSTSRRAKNYFIHQLTVNLLNHFINWELGNSLPYQILVSIVSKKVMLYVLNLFSNPEFLNYYILASCASNDKTRRLELQNYNRLKITKLTETGDVTPTNVGKSGDEVDEAKADSLSLPKDLNEIDGAKSSPEYCEFRSEEVKIYEPKSCKTWYDSLDVSLIPLGQDLLDTISLGESDRETDSLTEQDKDVLSPMTSAKNLLDEVKNMTTLEGLKTSIKPISDATANTLRNIKDFEETTVNNVVKPVSQVTSNALHKIGGLNLQDEAAGMVEGILDFGRTRIRKGLRLTGLQDSPPEEGIKVPPKKQITKMTHVKSEKSEDCETAWINPLQEEQASKTDGVAKVPSILTHSNEEGSPDLEYEETADLATSIAKLRSLLEQKSSESNMSTPALSPMPSDELSAKIEDLQLDEADGMMPSFYKFCAKTATGVIHNTLNTIKTALPGNVADCDSCDASEKWLFVESNAKESDLFARMQKLLCERKVFCTVDTAYEALDSLDSLQTADKLRQASIQFEDELDDFEVKLPMTKALFDILCELLADTKDTSMTQEPVIKSVMLLFGSYIEDNAMAFIKYCIHYCCANARIPSESRSETLSLEFEEFVDAILSGIPDHVKALFGDSNLRDVVNLFVSSLQVERINQDLLLQILEVLCMKLMDGSKQLTPISA